MGKRLEGKVALITGGASGIGRGIAEWYVREGAQVLLADLNGELLKEMKEALGDACVTVESDVTVEADADSIYATEVAGPKITVAETFADVVINPEKEDPATDLSYTLFNVQPTISEYLVHESNINAKARSALKEVVSNNEKESDVLFFLY